MPTNEIVSFEESVKMRLKEIVADLIPDDRWDEIVRVTVADFERNDLPKLVRAELAARYREQISLEFAKPEWVAVWKNGQWAASEKVREMLIEAAPLVLAEMLGGAMQAVMNQLQWKVTH